jgi:hypothetical protein
MYCIRFLVSAPCKVLSFACMITRTPNDLDEFAPALVFEPGTQHGKRLIMLGISMSVDNHQPSIPKYPARVQ